VVELEGKFGNKLRSQLHAGDRGVFEVLVDGELIFSKLATGRFPAKGEIARMVAARVSAGAGK
jgi:selT/selW/selH-like putative selenoprotein